MLRILVRSLDYIYRHLWTRGVGHNRRHGTILYAPCHWSYSIASCGWTQTPTRQGDAKRFDRNCNFACWLFHLCRCTQLLGILRRSTYHRPWQRTYVPRVSDYVHQPRPQLATRYGKLYASRIVGHRHRIGHLGRRYRFGAYWLSRRLLDRLGRKSFRRKHILPLRPQTLPAK